MWTIEFSGCYGGGGGEYFVCLVLFCIPTSLICLARACFRLTHSTAVFEKSVIQLHYLLRSHEVWELHGVSCLGVA